MSTTNRFVLMPVLLAGATLTLGGCSTAPRLPVAQVQAACPALEALPAGTDAAALYRQCRDAVRAPLNTDPHALPPPVLCTARPGSSAGALGPWAGVCQ
jgi:hypothetical protein